MRREDRRIADRSELAEVLGKADAAHVAMADGSEPYLVTMNYGFEWTGELPVLYFHCAREGRKLSILEKNPAVCFSVETDRELVTGKEACEFGMKYRSIVGFGTLSVITDRAERIHGLDTLMRRYAADTSFTYNERVFERTAVLKLTVRAMDGKKKT
jgi:nitroimidazol reductase NimA-like FMN-containing flavoprotein (pyridoxamine 5'-phosphate oxidase superfamily)